MQKLLSALVPFFVLTLLFPTAGFSQECFDITQRSDISDFQSEIQKAKSSTVRVNVQNSLVLAEQSDPFTPVNQEHLPNRGWGVIVQGDSDKRYVLTLLHVIGFNAERTFNRLKSAYPERYKNQVLHDKRHDVFIKTHDSRDSIKVNPEPVVAIGDRVIQQAGDALVLLELPNDAPDIPSSRLVRGGDCLKMLTDVWFIGSAQREDHEYGLKGFEINSSSVSSRGSGMHFRINREVVKGFSGSPVFAYHDGRLKVVGLVRAWSGARFRDRIVPTYSIAYKVDPITNILSNY